jgi:hypothetical protein
MSKDTEAHVIAAIFDFAKRMEGEIANPPARNAEDLMKVLRLDMDFWV